MAIQWNPEKMATGFADVDAQHQEWIRRYNQFDAAIQNQHGMESVRSTLDFFINYAETHFALEEARMAENHCSSAAANRAAHQVMRDMLVGFKKYLSKKEVSLSDVATLKLDMERWLTNHILEVDIKLRDCN
jgi:hemerythrin-like metal-binding protein